MIFSRNYIARVVFLIIFFWQLLIPAGQSADNAEPASSPAPTSGDIMGQTVGPILGGMDGKVSLDLRNIDVVDAFKFLAVKAGANIITTKNVSGRVTLMVENVVVKDIFDIMLRSNGLAYAKQSNIYNVMTEEEYKAIFGRKFSDIRQVVVFKLKYAIPEQAFSMIDALKSEVGRTLVEPDSGTVVIMDTPDRLKEIEKAIATLEQKNVVRVFILKYAKAKEVEDQLKPQLDGKKVGSIKADERSNQVIVQALPDRMQTIATLISALDTKTKEILLDTQIIKVKLSDNLDQGIQWQGLASLGKELGLMYLGSYPYSVMQVAQTAAGTVLPTRYGFSQANAANGIGEYPFSGNTNSNIGGSAVVPGDSMHLGLISGKRDLDVLVKYLQTLGKTQILSNPKIAVVNNQEARIHVGERQAYITSTTTKGQAVDTISEEVNFVDVGIQLAVTPTINDDGYVTMKVKPEVSSVVDFLITPSKNKIPIIDTSMAESTVMVKDGTTIIIGGLRREDKTSSYGQIPYLGKIPIIGFLFKSGSGKVERTELLIMLTPHILTGDKLTTGNERDFGAEKGKNYRKYKPISAGMGLKSEKMLPEEKIKGYQEYVEPALTRPEIKGVRR